MSDLIECPQCQGKVAAWVRCCDLCGAPMARLRWRAGGGWREPPILLVIGRGSRQIHVELTNEGAAPISLVLPRAEVERFPAWLDRQGAPLVATPLTLEPGQQHRLSIAVRPDALEPVFADPRAADAGRFEIPLRASLALPRALPTPSGPALGWAPAAVSLQLLVAREPRLSPRHAIFPFLARHRLARDARVLDLRLINETAEPLCLRSIRVQDLADPDDRSGLPLRPGAVRCPREAIAVTAGAPAAPLSNAAPSLAVLDPQGEARLPIQIVPPAPIPRPGALPEIASRFSACVQLELLVGQRPSWIDAVIEGVIGEAPDIVFVDAPGAPPDHPRDRSIELACDSVASASFRIRNPGSIPVNLRPEIALPEGGRPDSPGRADSPGRSDPPSADWLSWAEPPPDRLLPGEEVELRLSVRADQRSPAEMAADTCVRVIHLLHDGDPEGVPDPPPGAARPRWHRTTLRLLVRFQATLLDDDLFLGIDFGTSSSVVCALRKEHRATLPLDPRPADPADPARPPEVGHTLPSLLYFDAKNVSAPTDSPFTGSPFPTGSPFRIGSAARDAARRDPTNLVRSIKTVVARDPDHTFHFERRDPDTGALRLHPWRTQQLLDTFIRMLREQAERLITRLDPEPFHGLLGGLSAVRFTRAVFTHPVDIPPHARAALFSAARQAGLNAHLDTPERFFQAACVDEATAAVLGFLWLRITDALRLSPDEEEALAAACAPPAPDLPAQPERVLCVDIGGGTTDIAAVEIHDLAAFLQGEAPRVRVHLQAVTGDNKVGGDGIDLRLAQILLDRAPPSPDLDELRRALLARSPAEFRQQYEGRHAASPASPASPAAPADRAARAHRLYALAAELRQEAEAAKHYLNRDPAPRWILPGPLAAALRAPAAPASVGPPTSPPVPPVPGSPPITLSRQDLLDATAPDIARQRDLIREAVQSAGWGWEEITTLLFTGQGSRLHHLRDHLHTALLERRGPLPLPLLIEPDRPGFDPKSCVALGAAVWGAAHQSVPPWLHIGSRLDHSLTFDVQTFPGFRFLPIPGLRRGASFPATAEIALQPTLAELKLHRNSDRAPFLRFRWRRPATRARIVATGPASFHLHLFDADGPVEDVAGEILS